MAVLYSTGPIELEGSDTTEFLVKILNNSPSGTATGRIRAFSLNGTKVLIANPTFSIPPQSSTFVVIDVTGEFEVEFQIRVASLNGATDKQITSFVLPSVWGKEASPTPAESVFIPEHRFATAELRIVRPISDS
jgi:hypothetical protein